MKKFVFDIETDGLLDTLTKVWMLVFIDLDMGEEHVFCTDAMGEICPGVVPYRRTEDFIPFLAQFDSYSLTGHFILGFDLPALLKVFGWEPPEGTAIYDTMIMSQVQNYKRFGMRGHGLKLWGEFFGQPKPDHEDWLNYSPEMLVRCKEDTRINVRVRNFLFDELGKLVPKRPLLPRSIRIEHDVLSFCARAETNGWLFDTPAAIVVVEEITIRMTEIEDEIVPMLAIKTKIIDTEPVAPRWIKNGNYNASTARHFSIDPSWGQEEDPPIVGLYQRFEYVHPDLGNIDSVKQLLDKLGWVPDDWNWKKGENGEPIKGTPKLTSTSLVLLGPIGVKLDLYYTLRSRHQIISGWIKEVKPDGRLHGSCFTIATPTGRARHNGIVNVPKAGEETIYGSAMRAMFITPPGWKIIGADSSGNQMRASMAYVKSCEFGEGLTANTERSFGESH